MTYNSKNFHRLNSKQDLERNMSELGKTFLKISENKKKTENQAA